MSGQAKKVWRTLRLIGWNAVGLVVGLAVVAAAGEAYFRLTTPFLVTSQEERFHPRAGITLVPGSEIRKTNRLDFWIVSQANSLGFLDREPGSHERAGTTCHVAMIGDSFVDARHVSIADKFHVRLEDLAARTFPRIEITTSAFGFPGTGQINQLPYYDFFATHLHPRLLVLVFVHNDFVDNSPLLAAIDVGLDPDHMPFVSAERGEDGSMVLRPPVPDYRTFALPRPSGLMTRPQRLKRALRPLVRTSAFVNRVEAKISVLFLSGRWWNAPFWSSWTDLLKRRSSYALLLEGWQPPGDDMFDPFAESDLPPLYEDALQFTAFALDQWKERAERDDVSLVILASHSMGTRGHPAFDRMHSLADARGIPVVVQYDYIIRQGGNVGEAQFAHNRHWSPTGHRWAAEALLDHLKANPQLCKEADDAGRPRAA